MIKHSPAASFAVLVISSILSIHASAVVMQAEDYSWSFDTTPGNTGGAYKAGDTDIETTSDDSGFSVGWVETGEWLAFDNFLVPSSGTYSIKARVASPVGGEISFDLNGGDQQLGKLTVPNTGAWDAWETITLEANLSAGDFNFGVFAASGGWNLNWIEVIPVSLSNTDGSDGGSDGGNGGSSGSNDTGHVVWAVNAGGGAYTSSDGIAYVADEGFLGGSTSSTSDTINATPDAPLYQTERWGSNFAYAATIPNGRYSMTFRLAEIYWLSANQRKFSIVVEGQSRLASIDIVEEKATGAFAAYDLSVGNVVVADGQINIDFSSIVDAAKISAIVVRKQGDSSSDWQLVWQDEFNVDGPIDDSKWSHEEWAPGHVNNEWQRYTNRIENSRVENGKLIIEARKDNYMSDEYSSARVHARDKGDLLYGRVDVRAKLPNGRGTWPAIWMMPTDIYKYATNCDKNTGWVDGCDAWPNSGEIDILEHVGYDTGKVHATVHNLAGYWVNGQQRQASIYEPNVDNSFHTYSIEWSPERIDMFIDNALYFTYVNPNTGFEEWPYDHSYYVILNLVVGGDWGAVAGVDPNIWPQRMEVDYVRMYQR